jgi:hypothetical protein
VQELRARLESGSAATKDLSLVTLTPKWAGTLKTTPLQQFFEVIETTAHVGHWTSEHMVRIATMKLTDTAKAGTVNIRQV